MKINSGKSEEIIISYTKGGNIRNNKPNIKIDGMDVDKIDHAKCLSVIISHGPTWNKHMENIKNNNWEKIIYVVPVKTKIHLS